MTIVASCIYGLGLMGCCNLNYVIMNEVGNKRFRQKAILVLMVSWAFFEIVSALCFYLIKNWKVIYLVFVLIPALIQVILNFFMPETPKYLLS